MSFEELGEKYSEMMNGILAFINDDYEVKEVREVMDRHKRRAEYRTWVMSFMGEMIRRSTVTDKSKDTQNKLSMIRGMKDALMTGDYTEGITVSVILVRFVLIVQCCGDRLMHRVRESFFQMCESAISYSASLLTDDPLTPSLLAHVLFSISFSPQV